MKIPGSLLTALIGLAFAMNSAADDGLSDVALNASAQTELRQLTGALPGQIVSALPGQIVRALPGQITGPLPGQVVKSLIGQMTPPLPGQMAQALPGQIVRSLPWQPNLTGGLVLRPKPALAVATVTTHLARPGGISESASVRTK